VPNFFSCGEGEKVLPVLNIQCDSIPNTSTILFRLRYRNFGMRKISAACYQQCGLMRRKRHTLRQFPDFSCAIVSPHRSSIKD